MPGLFLYRSNRLEKLAGLLGEALAVPLADPLQAECIVVQSLGMRRWLNFRLAERLGVAMNCNFPFPHEFARDLFTAAFARAAPEGALNEAAMAWQIYFLLPELMKKPEFAPLKSYVDAGELQDLRRFQLSGQLATLYERFLVFAHHELCRWAKPRESSWQAQLWRALIRDSSEKHAPAQLGRLMEEAKKGGLTLASLPPRISLFGISSLPPFYLDLLRAAAKSMELHLFLFEPSPDFVGDLLSAKEQRRFLRKNLCPNEAPADHYLDAGNPLLASLGKASRQFAKEITELERFQETEAFERPEGVSLLTQIQQEIYDLEPAPELRDSSSGGDLSVQIHCCHGPVRELEVLRDQLLNLFERLPNLTPRDILVMTPDVEAFAPMIEAVFGVSSQGSPRIPFTVADRQEKAENAAAQTLLKILALHGSRMTAASVLEILEMGPILRTFNFSELDAAMIRSWVDQQYIRWGIDGDHRASLNLPNFDQNSWRAGLDQLLLGYALHGDGSQIFENVLPAEAVEGGNSLVFSEFLDFTSQLFGFITSLATSRTVTAWSAHLSKALQSFIGPYDEAASDLRRVTKVFEELAESCAQHTAPVPFEVIYSWLKQALSDRNSMRGFLSGPVTFCSIRPMRSIPFRVICLIGMNDTAFPRRDSSKTLRGLAEGTPFGHDRRDEDRQIFLESLLSARDVFYLSYSGLSPKNNQESPPSVVVSELLDYIASSGGSASDGAGPSLVTKHPLQPFSDAYFNPASALFSYSAENCRPANRELTEAGPLLDGPLPPLPVECHQVELTQLDAFFRNPAKYFLTERLNICLPSAAEELEECEPMSLDALDRWQSQYALMTGLLDGVNASALKAVLAASGVLPYGQLGREQVNTLAGAVDRLIERAEIPLSIRCPPLACVASLPPWEVSGVLDQMFAAGPVTCIPWRLKAKDRLCAWIRHLLLYASQQGESGQKTHVFSTDRTVVLHPLDSAEEHLNALLEIFAKGARQPLALCPETTYDFAYRTSGKAKGLTADPLTHARGEWEKHLKRDAHAAFCFGDREAEEVLDEEWQGLAQALWGPYLECAEESNAQ